MRLKTLLAALLMISLLAGCSLPATLATQITTLTAPNSPAPSSFADEELLTQEDAKQIALHHAMASEADTQGLRVSFEYDDGIPEYDLSFFFLYYEYEYEIHGVSGRIVSYERETY